VSVSFSLSMSVSVTESSWKQQTAAKQRIGFFVAFDDCKRRNSTEFVLKKKRVLNCALPEAEAGSNSGSDANSAVAAAIAHKKAHWTVCRGRRRGRASGRGSEKAHTKLTQNYLTKFWQQQPYGCECVCEREKERTRKMLTVRNLHLIVFAKNCTQNIHTLNNQLMLTIMNY